MAKKRARRPENDFDKLARLIKEESDDIRVEIRRLDKRIDELDKKVEYGFAMVMRRLDQILQKQLDEHAHRLKKLETAVFTGRR